MKVLLAAGDHGMEILKTACAVVLERTTLDSIYFIKYIERNPVHLIRQSEAFFLGTDIFEQRFCID